MLFLAAVPVLFAVFYIALSGKAFEQFFKYSHLKDKGNRRNAFLAGRFSVSFLICLGIVFMAVSLSHPFSLKKILPGVPPAGTEVIDYSFAVDISNSMTADDGGMTRLEHVKNALVSFIFSTDEMSRYSLTVFKGSAAVVMPLTSDKNLTVSIVEKISPEMYTSTGTSIAPAVEKAAQIFSEQERSLRKLFVFTDGEESPPGILRKDIKRISDTINSRMIESVIVLPDIQEGRLVNTGGAGHLSIPDTELMKKAADEWGGSVVSVSDFSAADFRARRQGYNSESDFSGLFLLFSFIFLFAADAVGRMKL